jgi:hypothetical protein
MADQPKRKTIPAKNSVETIVRAPKKEKGSTAKQDFNVKGSSSMSYHIIAGIGGAIVGGIIVSTGELMRL